MAPLGKRSTLIVWITVGVMLVCSLLISVFSGFQHENKKFKAFIVTLIVAYLFQILVGEPIYFAIQALYFTLRKSANKKEAETDIETASAKYKDLNYSRIEFLKQRLASVKSHLQLTDKHCDEQLNLKYKQISMELWLFVKYFILLLLVVVGSRDTLSYFNTQLMRKIIRHTSISTFGLNKTRSIYDMYKFINATLIDGFNGGKNYDNTVIRESGWIHLQMAKLLGVVRLRQIRQTEESFGIQEPDFATEDYEPEWKLPFHKHHYVDKYWRIYKPWMAIREGEELSWLTSFTIGGLHTYDEDNGYVALLARSVQNSGTVLEYLRRSSWLDQNTIALFIDFTLYNVDSNMFSICTVLAEQTPFGGIIHDVNVQSCELLFSLDSISNWGLIILMLYIFQFIQFAKALVLKLWYNPESYKSGWNIMDICIIIINIIVVILIFIREATVHYFIRSFESSNKLEFIDFRIPSTIDNITILFAAFLVCFTTLRIWKILQFASSFRMFTETLYSARHALGNITLVIMIFLFGFGFTSYIINGNNAENFTRVIKSFTSTMCFGFGFSSQITPNDLNHGGTILGFVMYLVLMLGLSILLLNFFITMICDHFSTVKAIERAKGPDKLSFWAFLKVEYPIITNWYNYLNPNTYKTKKGNYKNLVDSALRKLQRDLDFEKSQTKTAKEDREHDTEQHEDHLERLGRIEDISRILSTQMELLNLQLSLVDIEMDSDSDYIADNNDKNSDNEGDHDKSDIEQGKASKNGWNKWSCWLSKIKKKNRLTLQYLGVLFRFANP